LLVLSKVVPAPAPILPEPFVRPCVAPVSSSIQVASTSVYAVAVSSVADDGWKIAMLCPARMSLNV